MRMLIDSAALLAMAGEPLALETWAGRKPEEELFLSIVTADELLRGAEQADAARRARRLAFVEALLRQLSIVPLDEAIMRVHARLESEPDLPESGAASWIAATALAHDCRILTGHRELYAPFRGVEVEAWEPVTASPAT